MSEEPTKPSKQPKARHGSYGAYITGFLLSLLFTLIPYYLVTHESLKGNFLIAVILTFAFAQLLIQVIFFLHLGRERNPRFQTVFLAATFSAVCVVVGGSVWIMYHLQANMPAMEVIMKEADDESISQINGVKTGGCDGTNANYHIIFKNNVASPRIVTAHYCDSLTFTNDDKTTLYVAFGTRPRQTPYAGNLGMSLDKGFSSTITLSQKGNFTYYDKLHTSVNGVFIVKP